MGKLAEARGRLRDLLRSRKLERQVGHHAKENKLSSIRKDSARDVKDVNKSIENVKDRIEHLEQPPAPDFRVIPRSAWGARAPRAESPLASTSNGVFIHHTVGPAPDGLDAEINEMRAIQNFHMDSRGWNDIAYSFVVFPSGRIYEGRGKGVAGAHTEGYNSTSYAISFAGNYEVHEPSDKSIAAARWCRREYLRLAGAPRRGHRDVNSTACPGAKLYARLNEI